MAYDSIKRNADGFLNVSIIDKNGNSHRFKNGIPLFLDRKVDAALLQRVQQDPDFEIEITGSVFISNGDGSNAIEL